MIAVLMQRYGKDWIREEHVQPILASLSLKMAKLVDAIRDLGTQLACAFKKI